ncbi:MAG: hypothetical protein ACUVQ8_08850 [Nitrososphaeria archaeon]
MEAIKTNRNTVLILLSAVAIAAILSTLYLKAYATDDVTTTNMNFPFQGIWRSACRRGFGGFGFVEVSEEFKQKVINIAENDQGVQGLLAQGYNITDVRPIIKSTVNANGEVIVKASNAMLTLDNGNTMSHVLVWVDLNNGTVTKTVTITVTEKA